MRKALSLRAWISGGCAGENKDRKNRRKENGVMDRTRQSRAPRTKSSIRWIVCSSKMNPSSIYSRETSSENPSKLEGNEEIGSQVYLPGNQEMRTRISSFWKRAIARKLRGAMRPKAFLSATQPDRVRAKNHRVEPSYDTEFCFTGISWRARYRST